jgi:hypothetical protein
MPIINKEEILPGLEKTYYSLTGQHNPQALRIKNFLSGQINGADETGSFSLSPFGGLNFETNNGMGFYVDPAAKAAGINAGNFSLAGNWGQAPISSSRSNDFKEHEPLGGYGPKIQFGFNFGGVSQPHYFPESPLPPAYVKPQSLVVPGIYAGPHVDKLANEGARALTGNKVESIRIDPNQKFLEEMIGQYKAQGKL